MPNPQRHGKQRVLKWKVHVHNDDMLKKSETKCSPLPTKNSWEHLDQSRERVVHWGWFWTMDIRPFNFRFWVRLLQNLEPSSQLKNSNSFWKQQSPFRQLYYDHNYRCVYPRCGSTSKYHEITQKKIQQRQNNKKDPECWMKNQFSVELHHTCRFSLLSINLCFRVATVEKCIVTAFRKRWNSSCWSNSSFITGVIDDLKKVNTCLIPATGYASEG